MSFKASSLHNTYFGLRHGKSIANEEAIILSDPAHGVSGYGLTSEGKEQVRTSVEKAKQQRILDAATIIVSSDFARAKETAQIAAEVLGVEEITYTEKLRERFFGEWDKTHNSNYEKVWDTDRTDHTHKEKGVESVEEVLERTTKLVGDIEKMYTGRNILLVSHGDTLNILSTVFTGEHPALHGKVGPFQTAEIKKFN